VRNKLDHGVTTKK